MSADFSNAALKGRHEAVMRTKAFEVLLNFFLVFFFWLKSLGGLLD